MKLENSCFFSVIIPTFNRAHLISKALDSVINQTYENWELIIVDDGSTDNTKELISVYRENDTRVKYIYQENAERSAARNNGINNAQGEYICFLDSDDSYAIDNLENWSNFLELNKYPKKLAFCEMNVLDTNKTWITETEIFYENKFDFLFTNPIVPSRVCLHKDLLKDNKFENFMTVGEDVALWLKIIQNSSIIKSGHVGVDYFLHDENSVNPKNPAALKMLKGFSYYFKRNPSIKKKISKNIYNHYKSRIQTNVAKHFYFKGKKIIAVYYLINAIITCPIHEQTKYRLRLILLTFFSRNKRLYD